MVGLGRTDGLENSLRQSATAEERQRHLAHACLHRHPKPQVGVGVPLVGGQVEDRTPGLALAVGANLEAGDTGAVQPHLQRVAPLQPLDGVAVGPLQRDSDFILSVDREVVAGRETAPTAERVQLAHPRVLHQHRRCRVDGRGRSDGRIADRRFGDLARSEHVALQQSRRQRQDVGDVVEAVAQIVGRQQLAAVDLQGQQVPDGIGVLGAVQPVHGLGARVQVGGGGVVEPGLDPVDERPVCRLVRTRAARRRHLARAQLADDLLPGFRACPHVRHVERLERQPGRPQAIVVTGGAVAIQNGPVLGALGGVHRGNFGGGLGRLAARVRGGRRDEQDGQRDDRRRYEQTSEYREHWTPHSRDGGEISPKISVHYPNQPPQVSTRAPRRHDLSRGPEGRFPRGPTGPRLRTLTGAPQPRPAHRQGCCTGRSCPRGTHTRTADCRTSSSSSRRSTYG